MTTINADPTAVTINMIRGQDKVFKLTASPVVNITGWTFTLFAYDPWGSVMFTIPNSDITITDGPNGKMEVAFAASVTSGKDSFAYPFVVKRIDDGFDVVVVRGYLKLQKF